MDGHVIDHISEKWGQSKLVDGPASCYIIYGHGPFVST